MKKRLLGSFVRQSFGVSVKGAISPLGGEERIPAGRPKITALRAGLGQAKERVVQSDAI